MFHILFFCHNFKSVPSEPKFWVEKRTVVRDCDGGEYFSASLPSFPCTFSTEALLVLRVQTVEQLVPDLQEEPAVVRGVHGASCMMCVVLEAGVDDLVMRGDEAVLVATVKVDTVGVEEKSKLYEEKIHVDRHQEGQNKERRGAEYLVYWLICNHRKGRRVVEDMMVSVVVPKPEVKVTKSVVGKLKEIRDHPTNKKSAHMV